MDSPKAKDGNNAAGHGPVPVLRPMLPGIKGSGLRIPHSGFVGHNLRVFPMRNPEP